MKVEIADAHRFECRVPMRIEMLIRPGQSRWLRENVLAARGVLQLEFPQRVQALAGERQRALLA